MLKHTESYSEQIDDFMVRHFVKPGITGWAQVNGLRGETKQVEDMENRVKYDIWYIENWNFLLDFKILFLTIYRMTFGDPNAF
jgi:putative colanic acid biosynthesis UDP-glucose lipid carrier transferase